MGNPDYPVICTQGQWIKIAENVTSGQIWCMNKKVIYYHTYRLTGEDPPTSYEEGALIFEFNMPSHEILSAKSNEPVDIYIWCKNGDGSVRIDM